MYFNVRLKTESLEKLKKLLKNHHFNDRVFVCISVLCLYPSQRVNKLYNTF